MKGLPFPGPHFNPHSLAIYPILQIASILYQGLREVSRIPSLPRPLEIYRIYRASSVDSSTYFKRIGFVPLNDVYKGLHVQRQWSSR